MTQRLIVDVVKCTECRACELQCSFAHFRVFNANKSGIRIVSEWPELPKARVCIQCQDPACVPACPVDSLVYSETGAIQVVHKDCTGCGSCVDACPFDGIWLDPVSELAIMCDTCSGRFTCIPVCFAEALSMSAPGGRE